MTENTIQVGGVLPMSVVDGVGIRAVLFVTGCSHGCPGCHNKHLQASDAGVPMTVKEVAGKLLKSITRNYRGVTLSGGEPMEQPGPLVMLAKKLREKGVDNIWVYSGYTFEEICRDEEKMNLLRQCDVLVDGRFVLALKDLSLRFRGSSNQRVLDIPASLKAGCAVEYGACGRLVV